MIFLSAQPDSPYFIWQIELQLFHLAQKGWAIENVHALISYNPNVGPSLQANDLIEKFVDYEIFLYPDTRRSKRYASTVRPHIIEKHFECFPYLRDESIFYIDSDVVFREIPDFSILLNDQCWYASNTQSYMNSQLIIDALGYDVFKKMCKIVNISPELVLENTQGTGGAQYIIKNVPAWFWPKVEDDSNNLYNYLYDLLYVDTDHVFFGRHSLDIWITEMWVVCWNAILAGKTFVIHPILNFCWANQSKEHWNETYMLHYTGGGEGNFFRKTDFVLNSPFYSDLSYISDDSSSAQLKDLIMSYRLSLEKKRILMNDVTLLIPINTDCSSRIDNLGYLLKYIDINIMIIETGTVAKIDPKTLPDNVKYLYSHDTNIISNSLKNPSSLGIITDYIGVIPSNCIVPISQITETVNLLRNSLSMIVYPFENKIKVDVLTMHIFSKILDDNFLLSNIGALSSMDNTIESYPIFRKNKFSVNSTEGSDFCNVVSVDQVEGYLWFIR